MKSPDQEPSNDNERKGNEKNELSITDRNKQASVDTCIRCKERKRESVCVCVCVRERKTVRVKVRGRRRESMKKDRGKVRDVTEMV